MTLDKRDIYCIALGMLKSSAADAVNDLKRAGVNHPALDRLEVNRRVADVLSNPRLEIVTDSHQAFSAFVQGIYENARKEVGSA
ncbi:hypothetical protein D3C86_1530730 [compost metagenome]